MISKLKIDEFRNLKNIEVRIGQYITAITGLNGTGKTTILGLLCASSEIKTRTGKPLIQKQFRAEFSELFSSHPDFDKSGSNKGIIDITDPDNFSLVIEQRKIRTTWQGNGTRFRVLYRNSEGRDAKYEYPVIYLGLSRLYPQGESKEDADTEEFHFNEQEIEYFSTNYKEILGITDEIKTISNTNIKEKGENKAVLVETENYHYTGNSAGQDNVGQIIVAIMSFIKLRKEQGVDYKGGMLLIDEIESTLHPASQFKLLKYLTKQARENKIQVVFTTHSLYMLEELCTKVRHNNSEETNTIELSYLHRNGDVVKMYSNPKFVMLENNLRMVTSNIKNKINIVSEDDEARWFLKYIVEKSDYKDYFHLTQTKVPCNALIDFRSQTDLVFDRFMFVVDGDVPDDDISSSLSRNPIKNLVKLPLNSNPEISLYNYLLSIPDDDPYWENDQLVINGFTKSILQMNHPHNFEVSGKKREKAKAWFNYNLVYFNLSNILEKWYNDNKNVVDAFVAQLDEFYIRNFL